MSERVAIVAGAGGELGRVTAQKLAAAGFTVAGVDRPGLEPAAGMATAAASKAALVHLTRVLDLKLRPSGIPG